MLERRRAIRPGDRRDDGDWRRPLAEQAAVPPVDLGPGPVLGDLAAVVAGFRDEYYGLVGAVREHDGEGGDGAPGDRAAPARLVTSGAVDWAGTSWGERPVRFAKRRWRAPVVDPDLLAGAPAAARRWVERSRGPKLVVASQTRVVEAAVDEEGSWVPSVPALAVLPADPADLWLVACGAVAGGDRWLARRSAGTALDRHGIKVSGPDLAALPLPPGGGVAGGGVGPPVFRRPPDHRRARPLPGRGGRRLRGRRRRDHVVAGSGGPGRAHPSDGRSVSLDIKSGSALPGRPGNLVPDRRCHPGQPGCGSSGATKCPSPEFFTAVRAPTAPRTDQMARSRQPTRPAPAGDPLAGPSGNGDGGVHRGRW